MIKTELTDPFLKILPAHVLEMGSLLLHFWFLPILQVVINNQIYFPGHFYLCYAYKHTVVLNLLKGNHSKKPTRNIFSAIEIWISRAIFPFARKQMEGHKSQRPERQIILIDIQNITCYLRKSSERVTRTTADFKIYKSLVVRDPRRSEDFLKFAGCKTSGLHHFIILRTRYLLSSVFLPALGQQIT